MKKPGTRFSLVLVTFLLIQLFTQKTFAQDTVVLQLNDVLGRMDTSYPALLAYQQKLQSINASASATQSWMPPTISIGVDRFSYQPSMWMEDSPMNQSGIMVSAEQMFPNPAKLNAHYNAVQSASAPLAYDSAWMRNSLRAKARLYYYQRFIAERKLAILKESELVLDMLIATAEARYAVNQADLSTIFKAKARRTELTNMEAMLSAQIAESTIGLNTLMNRDVNTRFQIDSVLTLQTFAYTVVFDSLALRSDILAMNASIHAMQQQKVYMNTGSKPDFGIKVTHMQMLGMPNQFSIMGMMVVPIVPWSSGMYRYGVQAMDFQVQYMELERENMKLMARQMAAERLAMLKYENQQLRNYDTLILPAYKDNYDAAFLAYKNNTGSFFVLLDAWDMLLMKKMEATDQLFKVLVLQTQYQYEIEE